MWGNAGEMLVVCGGMLRVFGGFGEFVMTWWWFYGGLVVVCGWFSGILVVGSCLDCLGWCCLGWWLFGLLMFGLLVVGLVVVWVVGCLGWWLFGLLVVWAC